MNIRQISTCLLISALLCGCTTSTPRNFDVTDHSATFTNIEISKQLNSRWKVQYETSGSATTGSSYSSPILITNELTAGEKQTMPILEAIHLNQYEYENPGIFYDYSAKHQALSLGYDFINGKHLGLTLAVGVSQYKYSVTALMDGDVNVYQYKDEPFQVDFNEYTVQTRGHYDYEGTVTDKQFNFNYSALGAYISVEPHFQFNKYFGVNVRAASSFAKRNSSMYWLTGTELGIRFTFTPIEHLELYSGYQSWRIRNDLMSNSEGNQPSSDHKSHLNMNLGGIISGIALRF